MDPGKRRRDKRIATKLAAPKKKSSSSPKNGLGDVKNSGLSGRAKARIEWADGQMPVVRAIRERFANSGAAAFTSWAR